MINDLAPIPTPEYARSAMKLLVSNVSMSDVGFRQRPGWGIVLLGLVGWQTLTTLSLFDADRSGRSLLDDRPILNGMHPLHWYHAVLGGRSWREGGFGSCYDPSFQAGYPKTPVFDAGSRPGELFVLLGGEQAASYKVGLACCCLMVPIVFAVAARWLGCGPGTACLTAAFAILWWWSGPVQRLLEEGHTDWLWAGMALVAHTALTIRFHLTASWADWLGLLLTAAVGWFSHPIVWLGFGLLFVPFFVIVATGHSVLWSLALWGAWGLGVGVNLPWLMDWWRHCWIQVPLPLDPASTLQVSFTQWLTRQVGADGADRGLAAFLLGLGLWGNLAWIIRRRWSTGGMFAATALLLPALSLGSAFWQPFEAIGLSKLLVLAGFFAVIPCASGLSDLANFLGRMTRHPVRGAALVFTAMAVLVVAFDGDVQTIVQRARQARPWHIGLNRDQHRLVATLRAATRPEARILWEERPEHPTPNWSALLPLYTERAFVGGLDSHARVDHAHARLTSTELAGRPLDDWTDSELSDFCERYNIGYIVCWSPKPLQRFRNWSSVSPMVPVRDWGEGWLMEVRRLPSFILKGKARVVQIDARRIALAEVEPEDGVLVLSLHYQDGFRITPNDIVAEREPDPDDPIPRLRLRIPRPTLRVMLTWGRP